MSNEKEEATTAVEEASESSRGNDEVSPFKKPRFQESFMATTTPEEKNNDKQKEGTPRSVEKEQSDNGQHQGDEDESEHKESQEGAEPEEEQSSSEDDDGESDGSDSCIDNSGSDDDSESMDNEEFSSMLWPTRDGVKHSDPQQQMQTLMQDMLAMRQENAQLLQQHAERLGKRKSSDICK